MTVVTRHIGRLGNNMFQIANSIGYARKFGYEWATDPSSGHGEPYSVIHKVFPNLPKSEPNGMRHHEHPNGICKLHKCSFDDCHFDYHEHYNYGSNVTFTGFYQSWKYFEHCKEEVKKVFELDYYAEYSGYISIHVMRGDYIQYSGSFPPITEKYLDEAFTLFASSGGHPIPIFLIFSDDIQWCMENFKTDSYHTFEFCQEIDERKSLSMMSSCSHNIIANSSFSWWAAYLNDNPNKIVVSPSAETWFGPTSGVKQPVKDLILPEWIQIPTR